MGKQTLDASRIARRAHALVLTTFLIDLRDAYAPEAGQGAIDA